MGKVIKHKTKTVLIRLNDEEFQALTFKSQFFNMDKSKLLRQGALSYWDAHGDDFDSSAIFDLYQSTDDETVKQNIINVLFEYYRRTGYPHRKLSNHQINHEMVKISTTKSPLLENDHLQTNSSGVTLANFFHPHMCKVKCLTKYRSPYEQYANDDGLKDAIKRWMDLGKKPDPSGIRRILRTRDGVRSVVNFKPAISKFIYDTYVPTGGQVLDPCAGYGGRLCGLIASNRDLSYAGIDPTGQTAIGNTKLAAFFSKQHDLDGRTWKFNFNFAMGCAESIMPTLGQNQYDLIFTSPPYFNIERYDTTPDQSYIKFPTYEQWKDGFLRVVIEQSYRVCKAGGHLIWNIKNYKRHALADDSVKIAESVGFKLTKTYNMRLVNNEFHRKQTQDAWHTEPIFVLKKQT